MQVRHRLVIRHPHDRTILVAGGTPDIRLPAIVTDDAHTAEVDYLNAAVLAEFGLTTVVLRSLSHSDTDGEDIVRAHDLQARGEMPARPLRWISPEQPFATTEDRAAIATWRADAIVDGRDWTQPHWYAEACDWIGRIIDAADLGPLESIAQLRVWASSCVLQVRAGHADYFFKALPASGAREYHVTQYLAEHFPDVVPPLIDSDVRRRWLLLGACAGRKLEDVDHPNLWEHAARRYGRLQVDCLAHTSSLRELGCPVHDLETLARRIEPLCNDTGALRIGRTGGLTADEVERLRRAVPTLRRHCEQLAAAGVALTLEHGDLWPSNIFVDADHCAIIDWEDVIVAHPFFSLAPFCVGLRMSRVFTPELLARIEAAYLSAFTGIASKARLRSALHLAAPLGFIDMAIRYRHERPSVVAQNPWMRDLVPEALRLALAGLEGGAV